MAYDASGIWKPDAGTTEERLTGMLSKGSSYLKQAATAGKQYANSRGMLNGSLGAQAAEAARISAALPVAQSDAQMGSTERLASLGREHERGLAQLDADTRTRITEMDRASQERIAGINSAAYDREKAISAAASFNASYDDALKAVFANPDIPADARGQALEHFGRIRDANLGLVEQFYNLDLDWPSAVAPSPAPAGSPARSDPSPSPSPSPSSAGPANSASAPPSPFVDVAAYPANWWQNTP